MNIFNIFARNVCEVKVQDEHDCDDKIKYTTLKDI